EAIGVAGHAHYICREMKMMAERPDGTKEPLLYIDDWDLNWQGFYLYKKRRRLPAGTQLKTTLIYDNSADNPRNPHDPPQRVRWGRESTDEMGTVMLLILPAKKQDLARLLKEAHGHMIIGFSSAQSEAASEKPFWEETRPVDITRRIRDVRGKLHFPFHRTSGAKAMAMVFIAPDCPIANYYQPTLRRLHKAYADRGIPFFLVHSDPDLTAEEVIEHAETYKIEAPVVLDAERAYAKKFGARVTPEVFVIDRNATVLYSGRIDDTYTGFGRKRPKPRTHDLKDALEAIVTGEKIKRPKTKAVGCFISYR
ncbi:MAG: redoxin family protein, partial [Verrucomicrobiota bacterium]